MEVELTPDQFAAFVNNANQNAKRFAPAIKALGKPDEVLPALISFYVSVCHDEMSLEQCEEQTLLLIRTVWSLCKSRTAS